MRESASKSDKSSKDLQSAHDKIKADLHKITSEHKTLAGSHADLTAAHDILKAEHGNASKSFNDTDKSLKEASAELDQTKKTLGTVTKRADAAEKKRDALQTENGDLVSQLEELRGKVVKTSDEKIELAGKVESFESKAKNWEKAKAELETQLKTAKVCAMMELTNIRPRPRKWLPCLRRLTD